MLNNLYKYVSTDDSFSFVLLQGNFIKIKNDKVI